MNANVEVVCYKSKTLNNGQHPLMLRITKDRKIKYLSLGVSINQKHWDFTKNQPKSNCPNRKHIEKLILDTKTKYNNKIIEFTSLQKDYTPQSLVSTILKKNSTQKTISEAYLDCIQGYYEEGKIGNAKVYNYSYKSLQNFTKNTLSIPFSNVTDEWLGEYEKWLIKRGCKENTISQLFRTLRSIYNKTIKEGNAYKEHYPFDKFKVCKFSTKTPKRALSKEKIQEIQYLDLSKESYYTQFSRDIFMFSYFMAGMNLVDIALLKQSSIKDNRIHYVRKKTGKEISLKLTHKALEILLKYQSSNIHKDEYIFPILDLNKHKTPIQIDNRTHKVMGQINKHLKKIGGLVGVLNLTTYASRHTFATVLKKSGVNIGIISEALGHQNIKTTEIYLSKFDNEQIDNAMECLL